MTEETRSYVNMVELVNPPRRSYITPIPKDGLIYDYKFVKDGAGRCVHVMSRDNFHVRHYSDSMTKQMLF